MCNTPTYMKGQVRVNVNSAPKSHLWSIAGLVPRRPVALLLGLLALAVLVGEGGQVWAVQSFNPNPPIAGQSFTISGSCTSAPCVVIVIRASGHGCGPGTTVASLGPFNGPSGGPGSYIATVPAQPQGSYSTMTIGGEGCIFFTIDPAPPTPSSYVSPVAIGGTMLPINQLEIIVPWVALFAGLAVMAVWAFVVKREHRD